MKKWLSETAIAKPDQVVVEEHRKIKEPVVLDQDALMERLNNNKELYRMVMEMFLEKTPATIAELQEAITTNDSTTTQLLAHNLKGTAANLGAETLYDSAQILEQSGKENDLAKADDILKNIKNGFTDLKKEIDTALADLEKSS
jgi:HPt (histidine-containing phosphotransfer) domain-containing protein